ncbi:hypothetical protein K438DRAFT_1500899, partial [Mycena galopus ATCC 62051]
VVSLALFFGLFFGLNYPEIVRHGWPLTRCTILGSDLATRYCCTTSCPSSTCPSAPSGATTCGSVISSIDSGYNPTTCATNSSSCPTQIGSVCSGGYQCCDYCCQTCKTCSSTCSKGTCSQTCTHYKCNCECFSSTSNLDCTISCPTCYSIAMQVRYSSRDGEGHSVSYDQEFSTNVNNAEVFFSEHTVDSTGFCYYNPKDESQILFGITFTTWKWVVTAIFGAFPLAVSL